MSANQIGVVCGIVVVVYLLWRRYVRASEVRATLGDVTSISLEPQRKQKQKPSPITTMYR